MKDCPRRTFLKTLALGGAALKLGPFAWDALAAASGPSLSIAHYRNSPKEPDGISEESQRLTREAIAGLGGMQRFVSRGDIVWVKPNPNGAFAEKNPLVIPSANAEKDDM